MYIQIMTVLNHATSYATVWKYLKKLTQEVNVLEDHKRRILVVGL